MSAVPDNTVSEMPSPLLFTEAAALKVKSLIEEEGNPGLMLRVFVSGGGCSGFLQGFSAAFCPRLCAFFGNPGCFQHFTCRMIIFARPHLW